MRFFICLICLFLSSCFTIPPKDNIITIQGILPHQPTSVAPLRNPVSHITEIPQPQTLVDKYRYTRECMINYSWGRGYTVREAFNN